MAIKAFNLYTYQAFCGMDLLVLCSASLLLTNFPLVSTGILKSDIVINIKLHHTYNHHVFHQINTMNISYIRYKKHLVSIVSLIKIYIYVTSVSAK